MDFACFEFGHPQQLCEKSSGITKARGHDRDKESPFARDIAMCAAKFPDLICVPIAACAMEDRLVALFSFDAARRGEDSTIAITAEKHYHLVPPEQISAEDLHSYAKIPSAMP